MTQTDQMNEMSFRSDEQAQSQDRERLQEDIAEAWERIENLAYSSTSDFLKEDILHFNEDRRLLRWALGLGS